MNIDMSQVRLSHFGVGRDLKDTQEFVEVPASKAVKEVLSEMLMQTWKEMNAENPSPPDYDPSNTHSANEHLVLPLTDPNVAHLRSLHTSDALLIDAAALSQPNDIFCYFFRVTDASGRAVTGVRRSTQFKAAIKPRSKFLTFHDDSVQLVRNKLFKLDNDFDLLIIDDRIHIWRPSSFEFTGRLQEAIMASVPHNITALTLALPNVEWKSLEEYAKRHPRAARHVASIRQDAQLSGIDPSTLIRICIDTAVDVTETEGRLSITPGHELGFLEVLGRRRYPIELIPGQRERYKATNRTRLR